MKFNLQEVAPDHFDILNEGGNIVAAIVETPTEGWYVLLSEAFSDEDRFPGRIVDSAGKLCDMLPLFLRAMEANSSIG
jgi:hypothetical protein